jgi:hypothetical protein
VKLGACVNKKNHPEDVKKNTIKNPDVSQALHLTILLKCVSSITFVVAVFKSFILTWTGTHADEFS